MKPHSWQRTAKYYRARGYTVVKTEYTSRGTRHDLMGFIDGLAFTFGQTVALQACLGGDFAEHKRKILGPCRQQALDWMLGSGDHEIHLVGWRKVGARGKRKTWQPRIERITLDDLM